MSLDIGNDYSKFNSYSYKEKNIVSKALDWLSTPCRSIAGGRDVCVLSQTYYHPISTTNKVVVAFFLVIVLPVGAVSFSALLLKLITCPSKWESKKVRIQTERTWELIRHFNNAVGNGNIQESVRILTEQPEILKRTTEQRDFYNSVYVKICNNCNWNELQNSLSFFKRDEAFALLNKAVIVRLREACADNCNVFTANELMDLIKNSVNGQIEACYASLFKSALKIKPSEDPFQNCIKLDLANQMIKSLMDQKRVLSRSSLDKLKIDVEERTMRLELLKGGNTFIMYRTLFFDDDGMRECRTSIQCFREINQIGSGALGSVQRYLRNTNESKVQKAANGFAMLAHAINFSFTSNDREYVERSRNFANAMSCQLRSLNSSSDHSIINANIENLINEHRTCLPTTHNPTPGLLTLLKLKQTQRLTHYIEAMNAELLTCTAAGIIDSASFE